MSINFQEGVNVRRGEYKKTKSTFSSPYGRGAAVFEAGAENYGCGEGAILSCRKKIKNGKI